MSAMQDHIIYLRCSHVKRGSTISLAANEAAATAGGVASATARGSAGTTALGVAGTTALGVTRIAGRNAGDGPRSHDDSPGDENIEPTQQRLRISADKIQGRPQLA